MANLEQNVKDAVNDIYPFYMPGHKRNRNMFPVDMLGVDVTEIPGTDNLHSPGSIILESMQYAAKACGAEESFFLVNGSSGGVIAAILACVGEGESIIVARNTHKSVYTGMIFAGAKPVYIQPEITDDGLQGGIDPAELNEILNDHPEVKTVLITSPTFEGFVSDIAAIAQVVHDHDAVLIVDEAHGAHFPYSDFFPKSAVLLGADIVIQSLHKTLPTLTQTAIIHMNGRRVDRESLRYMLTLVQSTSPSYVFMCVADKAIRSLTEDRSIMESYAKRILAFRSKLADCRAIRLLGKEQAGKNSIFDVDLGRLCFVTASLELGGKKLENLLRNKYRLQAEYSGLNYLIGISSPADTDEGFNMLADAILDISKNLPINKTPKKPLYADAEPIVVMPPRVAFYYGNGREIPFDDSEGLISQGFVIPYPPGIPLLAPGERITEECIASISACVENGLEMVGNGYRNGLIRVL